MQEEERQNCKSSDEFTYNSVSQEALLGSHEKQKEEK